MIESKDKSAQVRAFKTISGKNLQYLVNEAYRIVENPLIITNLWWDVLAYTEDAVSDDPIWSHHLQNATIKDNIKSFAISIGMGEALLSIKKTKRLHYEGLKYDRIVSKLYNSHGLIMAYAILVASDRPFTDCDVSIFDSICGKLAEEMRKIDHYANHGQMALELFINRLIDIDLRHQGCSRGFAEYIYSGLKNHLYVAVADISQCDPTFSRIDYYKKHFQMIRPAFKYSVYKKHIIIIMSTDEEKLYPKKIFNRLNRLLTQHQIRVGISNRFENLFDLRKHYSEAVKALKDGLRRGDDQLIYVYGDEMNM